MELSEISYLLFGFSAFFRCIMRSKSLPPLLPSSSSRLLKNIFRTPEVETLNNLWPFRFQKGVLIFILFQIANLNRSYRNTCSHFHFFSKRKSGRPDFRKGVHICVLMKIEMWTPFLYRFGQERCLDFNFHQKRKCEHLTKNLDGQICVLKKK